MKKDKKNNQDFLLDAYKHSGLSRRRFLSRIGMQITGAGLLISAFANKAKACGCSSCNSGCNQGCNSCDINVCDEDDVCSPSNVCNYDICLKNDTCGRDTCTTNECEKNDICSTDTCQRDQCSDGNTCGTDSCNYDSCPQNNVCEPSNVCSYANNDS